MTDLESAEGDKLSSKVKSLGGQIMSDGGTADYQVFPLIREERCRAEARSKAVSSVWLVRCFCGRMLNAQEISHAIYLIQALLHVELVTSQLLMSYQAENRE